MQKGFSFLIVLIVGLFMLLLVFLGITYYFTNDQNSVKTTSDKKSNQPTQQTESSTNADYQLLDQLARWVPKAQWESIVKDEIDWQGRKISGFSRAAKLESDTPLGRFESDQELKEQGWALGEGEASGQGGEVWEYVKAMDGKQRILQFFYQNRSMKQNPSGGFDTTCPCRYELQVFLSNPF